MGLQQNDDTAETPIIDIEINISQNILIDIDIFQNSHIDILQNPFIDIDIFFRMALSISISIFFKSVDISTIDNRYRYIEQAYRRVRFSRVHFWSAHDQYRMGLDGKRWDQEVP